MDIGANTSASAMGGGVRWPENHGEPQDIHDLFSVACGTFSGWPAKIIRTTGHPRSSVPVEPSQVLLTWISCFSQLKGSAGSFLRVQGLDSTERVTSS